MAYQATYSADDLGPAIIDGGTKVVITLASLAVIFAFLLAWVIVKVLVKR